MLPWLAWTSLWRDLLFVERQSSCLCLPHTEIPGVGHHACSNIFINGKCYTLAPWKAILGKVLFGRKRRFTCEFKRLPLVLPYHSKLCVVIVVTEGEGLESNPGPLHAKHMYPLGHIPSLPAPCHWTMSLASSFLRMVLGITLMHADCVIAHCQWPTPQPANPARYFPSYSVPSLLVLGSKLRVSLPILLDKCSTSEVHLQPSNIV